jgi:hypothetical protein
VTRRTTARTAVLVSLLLALLLQGAPRSAAGTASRGGTLSVTSAPLVGGAVIRFTGDIGATGRRAVHIQWNMNREGDVWVDVAGTTHMTDRSGRFDFPFIAPSALGLPIGLRVASGNLATPAYQLRARPQEITVGLAGARTGQTSYGVAPGELMSVVVDTTPDVRSALGTPPAIPGRSISLQQRVDGNRWTTIATGATDGAGHAAFEVRAPTTGSIVLRARQERWTAGGNRIGWFPSFPTYFTVDPLDRLLDVVTGLTGSRRQAPTAARKDPLRPTASQTWGWGGSLWDYDWGFGEDFDSDPYRGTWMDGTWVDTSDGTGRAVPFNGGLVLQSKLAHTGPGDVGTTTATLRDGAQTRGRWEFRLQGHAWETGPRPYRFLLELVPEGAPHVTCQAASIVVADVLVGTKGVGIGVRSARKGATWTGRDRRARLAEAPFNMAVEVGKKHITWFRDAKPIATVKGRAAQLGVPLVPRFSLVGGPEEMNGAQVDSDWQRMFSLDRGKQVRSGRALSRRTYSETC